MGPRMAEMVEDGLLGAAGFFQAVCENGQARRVEVTTGQEALVIGSLGERHDRRASPGWGEPGRAEGVAEDVAQQDSLCGKPSGPVRGVWGRMRIVHRMC